MKFSESLKKNKDFQVVYKNGKSYANRYLVLYIREVYQPQGGVCTNENDISAKEKIQSKSSRIQSKNEHTRRKKSFSCQKSKRKKTVISLGRIYVAFSSIKKCSISRGKSC